MQLIDGVPWPLGHIESQAVRDGTVVLAGGRGARAHCAQEPPGQ